MTEGLAAEIAELQERHVGFSHVAGSADGTRISGALPFEAVEERIGTIRDEFEIEIFVPAEYPKELPSVRETAGRIDSRYEHLFLDGTLCLGVPIRIREIFNRQPTLLGFVNRLVIPNLAGYSHWEKHDEFPFGEQKHGPTGIVEYYQELFDLADPVAVLAVVCFLLEHGYRGHHPCPCGSAIRVRKCHGRVLRHLKENHTDQTIRYDFLKAIEVVVDSYKRGEISIPPSLKRQALRLLKRVT